MIRRMLLVGLLTTGVAIMAIDARSTYGARVSSDEPQYLLTAISLGEDLDLDISDELAEQRYLPFHEITLDPQTTGLNASGQQLSPHDPLLPLLLALPVRVAGWQGAKIALAVVLGLTAAATLYGAERRFRVSPLAATVVVGGCFVTPPLTAYGSQIYPAAAAALAVMAGYLAVTAGPRYPRLTGGVALAAIVALPWLSVKYVPLALILTVAWGWRLRTEPGRLALHGALLGVSGLLYLLVHQRIYGGWTVYEAGDHFIGDEFSVVGSDPNYLGRSRRLIGLLLDRGFGIAAWAPVYLAAVPALTTVFRRRLANSSLLLALLAAGWATATWVALTMHGWWWPGRQVVPVLPLVVLALARWSDGHRRRLAVIVTASALAASTWLWLVWEASTGRRALIVDFEDTASPWYRTWRELLPDHRLFGTPDMLLTVLWSLVLGLLAVAAWRREDIDAAR